MTALSSHGFSARPKQCLTMWSAASWRQALMRTTLITSLSLAAVGCGKTGEDAAEPDGYQEKRQDFEAFIRPRHDLMALACLYLDCEEKQRRPPTAPSDLQGHSALHRRALHGLQEGRYTLHWGLDLRWLRHADRSEVLLGYQSTPSQRRTRWVVMADAQVREFREHEFEQVMARQPRVGKPWKRP